MRMRPTPAERAKRREHRAEARTGRLAKIMGNRDWHQARAQQAEARREAKAEAKRRKREEQDKGVERPRSAPRPPTKKVRDRSIP
jgi:hypothetical protein